MSLILDRCPFYEVATEVDTATGPVLVRAYQIVVWVGIWHHGDLSRPFPAILDTGHSHNFSIRTDHLESWAGSRAAEIKTIGRARVNKQIVELKNAAISIFPNTPENRDARLDAQPFGLNLPEGIAIHGASDPYAPGYRSWDSGHWSKIDYCSASMLDEGRFRLNKAKLQSGLSQPMGNQR